MKPNALKNGVFRGELPGQIEITPGLFWVITHDHIDAPQRRENGEGSGVEHDRFASGLAVREEQKSSLLRIVGALTAPHIHGTCVPVEEPSTASLADVGGATSGAAVMGAVLVLPPPRSCTTTLLYERDRKFGEVNDLRCNRPRDQIADRTHAACSHHDPIAAQSLGA